ncbi:hypothetical protein AAVH_05721 [Aphelenchoides avenae]|nr:hypothetical protein AAVH_05721 [Aphelenchus avenae]
MGEYPTNVSQFNDARSRRLQVLHCIVNGIPLSGRGLRKSARVSLRQRIQELHEIAGTNEDSDVVLRDESVAEQVPEEEIDPVGEDFVHVGLVREHEVVDDDGNWIHVNVDAPTQQEFRLPKAAKIDHRCAAWQLRNALRSRYVPHHFARPRRDGKKPRHSIYEDMRISESAFFHILDALWKIEGFRGQMERIIKENDASFRRNNWQRLQAVQRPRCYHNPFRPIFDPDGRETLCVPKRYERLVTVADAEGLRQATAILRSMTTDDVTGIDTEGGNDTSWPETIQVSSKVHSILVDVRTCTEQAPTNLLNDFIYWLFANPSKKFGMAFDEADRCKITAAIGTSTSKQELQRLVLTAKVDDIRQLVFDTLAYDENGRYVGLADYVMERPRLSHFVHAVLQKKLAKAYTCSMWASRPLFEEQLTYAHLDCICIVLMVERCLENPRGPQVFSSMTRKASSQGWRQAAGNIDEDDVFDEYDDHPFVTYDPDTGENAPTTSRATTAARRAIPATSKAVEPTGRGAQSAGTVAAEFAARATALPWVPAMEGLNAKNKARMRAALRPKTTPSYDDGSEWEVLCHPSGSKHPANAAHP